MNKITLAIVVWCGAVFGCAAQTMNTLDKGAESIEMISCSDPEYDWQQFEKKTGKALVTKKGLELESKKDDIYTLTFCELPVDVTEDNFVVRFDMSPAGFSDEKPFGIIFDYENATKYRMIVFLKKSYQFVTVDDGKMSVVKEGLYKLKGKNKSVTVDLKQYRGKLFCAINGLEMMKTKTPELKNPMFGFIVGPKSKMICNSIGYYRESSVNDEDPE